MRFHAYAAAFSIAALSLAACGGGGGGGGVSAASAPVTAAPTTVPSATPVAPATTTPATAAPQVIKIALPVGNMGALNDPVYGPIGGYTQNSSSQVLGLPPGQQVMLQNIAAGTPHTLNIIGTSGFGSGPGGTGAAGGNTIGSGFASGPINGGQTIGPFTLAAGTYYFGCAFHYTSNMRDVIVVAAGAVPGPQATPVPAPAGTTPPQPCIGGYC